MILIQVKYKGKLVTVDQTEPTPVRTCESSNRQAEKKTKDRQKAELPYCKVANQAGHWQPK